jgi:ubiquitin C-terminal hydrolase
MLPIVFLACGEKQPTPSHPAPAVKKPLPGLSNLVNTCFANSSINLLFSSNTIKNILKKNLTQKSGEKPEEFSHRVNFHKAMNNLFSARKMRQTKLCNELNAFFDAYEKAREAIFGSELVGDTDKIRRDQSDARAFTSDVLRILGLEAPIFHYDHFADGSTKTYAEQELIIEIGLDSTIQNKSISELLDKWAASEPMRAPYQPYNAAGVKMNADRFMTLKMPAPDSLFVSLNRFEVNLTGGEPERLSNAIIPSKDIKMPATDEKDLQKKATVSYELRAIIVQSGSLKGGHYYAFVFNKSTNQWTNFDDTRVTVVDEAAVMKDATNNGYVFLYERLK